jgi:exodeoxyribonuclease VII small subunit
MRKTEPTFEQLFEELEMTVQKLEAGNLTLDESMALYERGLKLAQQCNARLDSAELRIKELAPALAGGLEADADDGRVDEEESD